MTRLRRISDEDANEEQRRLFDSDVEQYGDVLNTTQAYAHFPSLVPPLKALHASLDAGTLPAGLVSLARLKVAGINGCPF